MRLACAMRGFREESPAEELCGFRDAIRTVLLYRSFRGYLGLKDHLESLDADFWLMRREDQLTG